MNRSIYTKLAISNLKNNRKTYIPYVLTAILTVMMYYMMANLAANSPMNQEALQIILSLSVHVIEIFALIFLFYTNSFLIKRRKREIGVYHILGMGKPQLAKMLVIETVVTGAVSILGGIFFGTALAKLMYALLKRMIHYDDKLAFRMSWEIAGNTVLFFTLIFALTLIYNLLQIRLANPIDLLHAGSQGEREPKTKWFLTMAGIIFLGIGYYIAITTKEPLKALQLFFVAVICVIIGTYALFTAGSIAFLKLLRKNKNFYYKTKHFTSVSGMLYRMKQNAVGLSNICVLSTMVLVIISSTVSLYIGKEDVLRTIVLSTQIFEQPDCISASISVKRAGYGCKMLCFIIEIFAFSEAALKKRILACCKKRIGSDNDTDYCDKEKLKRLKWFFCRNRNVITDSKENDSSHSQKPFGFRLALALTSRMQKIDRIGKPDLQKIIDQSQCKDQREKENGISRQSPMTSEMPVYRHNESFFSEVHTSALQAQFRKRLHPGDRPHR